MSNVNTSDLNALKKSNEQSIDESKLFTTEERMELLKCINNQIVKLQINDAFNIENQKLYDTLKEKIITHF